MSEQAGWKSVSRAGPCEKIDEKVLQYFHLEEKEYEYQSLIGKIREEMKEEILEDICGECSWYQNDGCIIRECVGIEG